MIGGCVVLLMWGKVGEKTRNRADLCSSLDLVIAIVAATAALYLLDGVEGFGMTCSTMNPLPVGK